MMRVRRIIASIVVLVLAGCPSDPSTPDAGREASGPCGPSTCGGCCQGQACMTGTGVEACGAGGLPCVVCGEGELCSGGQCLNSKCNPSTCPSGCCKDESCQAGTSNEICGKGGQLCAACSSSQKCVNQSCGCSPATCSGCCEGQTCRSGATTGACGTGGDACKKCEAAQVCSNGTCKGSTGCTPASCKGCCVGGQCKPGTDNGYCGNGGQTCETCTGTDVCVSGVCNDPANCNAQSCPNGCCQNGKCLSGTSSSACGKTGAACKACVAPQLCQASACKVDPASSWGIIVVSADLDTSKSWDWPVYTLPDAYVEVVVGSLKGNTSTKSETYTPQWDEYLFAVSAGTLAASSMKVTVYDDDLTPDEVIGACVIGVPDDVLLSGSGIVNSCGSEGWVKRLEFRFVQK